MKSWTHITIGLTSGFVSGVININSPLETTYITCGVFILASILPDFGAHLPTKHRGVTHSILFGIILSILIFFIFPNILIAFLLGFYLHLLADMFTNSGVQLLFPLKKKMGFYIKGYDYPTEYIIQVCCYLIIGILFLIMFLSFPNHFLFSKISHSISL